MAKGTVRYEYEPRLEDYVIRAMAKMHLIEIEGKYPILLDEYGDTIGAYLAISGWRPIVKWLEWYSGFTLKRKIALVQ